MSFHAPTPSPVLIFLDYYQERWKRPKIGRHSGAPLVHTVWVLQRNNHRRNVHLHEVGSDQRLQYAAVVAVHSFVWLIGFTDRQIQDNSHYDSSKIIRWRYTMCHPTAFIFWTSYRKVETLFTYEGFCANNLAKTCINTNPTSIVPPMVRSLAQCSTTDSKQHIRGCRLTPHVCELPF